MTGTSSRPCWWRIEDGKPWNFGDPTTQEVLRKFQDFTQNIIPASFEPRFGEKCWCGEAARFWSSSGDGYACDEHRGSLFVMISARLRTERWLARDLP